MLILKPESRNAIVYRSRNFTFRFFNVLDNLDC